MSGFSSSWLTLREPYDRRARNGAVLDAVRGWAAGRTSVAVVDLACGLGSTLRGVTESLPRRQSWRLADNDLSLLARAADLARPPDLTVTAVPVDLARDLEAALDGPVELVTTSALLDLVSHDWLDRLVTETAARRLPIYAALSYDGLATLDPADPFDCAVIDAVNQHQRARQGVRPGARARCRRDRAGALRGGRLSGGAGRVGLGVRAEGHRDPDRGADRLGGRGARDQRVLDRRDHQLAGAPARPHRGRPLNRCGSVTSIFSPGRPRRAEPSGRSRAALPRRSDAPASGRAAPGRRSRSA